MQARKILRRLIIGSFALVSLGTVWGLHRNSRLHSQFRAIQHGMSQAEVVRLLGTPSWSEPCGKTFGDPRPNCTEFLYKNSFAPLVPEYHSVSFDPSGHVVETYIYSSP